MSSVLSRPEDLNVDLAEWRESLDYILQAYGPAGVSAVLRAVQDHALSRGVALNEATLNTAYVNTISLPDQPQYPGQVDIEKRLENINRWNAMAMVLRAVDNGSGVGGHIATYASAATMMEVGFNHFFRARSADYGGDLFIPQPHASPGVYARAFLEVLSAPALDARLLASAMRVDGLVDAYRHLSGALR
jgi:pyruvate dehydrogenase E1 component